jgi:hypothetical protein
MHTDQAPWRDLYTALLDDDGPAYVRVLADWAAQHPAEVEWLASLAERRGAPVPEATTSELWRLYALSRVNETMLLRFQTGDADGSHWPGPQLSMQQYRAFMNSLGLREVEVDEFTPFCHEIVSVDQADDDAETITVTDVRWPCLMLGDLLISRAGVAVRGGRQHVVKEPAETSCLYWAYRRKHRPTTDLSDGWGSNSQWRTSFRRDYLIDGVRYYNVDAEPDLMQDQRTGLTPQQDRQLLIHRCFITEPEPEPVGEQWPYELFAIETM